MVFLIFIFLLIFLKSKKPNLRFFLFFIIFALVFSSGVLVLLVFRNQIVHVRFSFSKFHLVHTFTSVPMEKRFPPEHSGKLFRNPLEEFLDGGRVTDKGGGHFKTSWWD